MRDLIEWERKTKERERLDAKTDWLIWPGLIFRALFYGGCIYLVMQIAPHGLRDKPLGQITPNEIFWAVVCTAIGMGLFWLAFNPSKDKQVRRAWAWISVSAVILLGLAFLFIIVKS